MTEGPHRSSTSDEHCAVCRARTESTCERCELPLCDDHLPRDGARCVGCEKLCEICEAPTPEGCRRCLRPVCGEHRDKRDWCKPCADAWKEHTRDVRGALGFVSCVVGVFTVGMVTMGGPAGLIFGGVVAVPVALIAWRWPKYRQRWELEERERAAKQLPAGLDFRRDR